MELKGIQHPTQRALYDLLNDPEVTNGLVVNFRCGLRYVVGTGWQTLAGDEVTDDIAHRVLRAAWKAEAHAEWLRGSAAGAAHAKARRDERRR